MTRRRYRIEATLDTLDRFVRVLLNNNGKRSNFIQRVTTNSTEEYYYVVVLSPPEVHEALKAHRFADSTAMELGD